MYVTPRAACDMEEFSVFKSKDKSKKCIGHHSLFVPHIPLFANNGKTSSVADLVALNERYYDIDKKISASSAAVAAASTLLATHGSTYTSSTSSSSNQTIEKHNYKKYEPIPVRLKRKRIKDIDLRFTNTGIMPYCEYLRGVNAPTNKKELPVQSST